MPLYVLKSTDSVPNYPRSYFGSRYGLQPPDKNSVVFTESVDDAAKFRSESDAAAFREGHQWRPGGMGLLSTEIEKLTDAHAWESGMRPAWEGEAERERAKAAVEAEETDDSYVIQLFLFRKWRPSFENPGLYTRAKAESLVRDAPEQVRRCYRVVPFREVGQP